MGKITITTSIGVFRFTRISGRWYAIDVLILTRLLGDIPVLASLGELVDFLCRVGYRKVAKKLRKELFSRGKLLTG